MMTSPLEALKLFQSPMNRDIEENFVRTFAENYALSLKFINSNQAYTDGRVIVVDPAMDDLYCNRKVLSKTEAWLKLDNKFSSNPWNALKMITRHQSIHEALHIIYSNFPPEAFRDPRGTSKSRQKVLALIANIIEDAFIEAVGCTVYDNLALFLKFGRLANMFDCQRVAAQKIYKVNELASVLEQYLEYMLMLVLYPMQPMEQPPAAIVEYVLATKDWFIQGTLCGDPNLRFSYAQRIFDRIDSLIPPDSIGLELGDLEGLLIIVFTDEGNQSKGKPWTSKGKSCGKVNGLFVIGGEQNGTEHDVLESILADFLDDLQSADTDQSKVDMMKSCYGNTLTQSKWHRGIKVQEKRPRITMAFKPAYHKIFCEYRSVINSYNAKFAQLLQVPISSRDEYQFYGDGLASKRLGDVQGRMWFKRNSELGVPELSVMLLIDGSNSMGGQRLASSKVATVILHEVLKHQGIEHAVVCHRAPWEQRAIDVNVLMGFNDRNNEQYNLMLLDAGEGSRDGLAVAWAEKYLQQHAHGSDKLLIIICDGQPHHGVDHYYPPASCLDTASIVKGVISRGTKITAIALDNYKHDHCYESLQAIYPSIVQCTDLKQLTGQLLQVIAQQFIAR